MTNTQPNATDKTSVASQFIKIDVSPYSVFGSLSPNEKQAIRQSQFTNGLEEIKSNQEPKRVTVALPLDYNSVPLRNSVSPYLSNLSGEQSKNAYSFDSQTRQFNREHNRFKNPRTLEVFEFVSLGNFSKQKTVRCKKNSYLNANREVIRQSPNEQLNAKIPKTAYHRATNAITLTPCYLRNGEIEQPKQFIKKQTNSQKWVYGESQSVSLATIKKHSAKRSYSIQEPKRRTFYNMVRTKRD